MLLVFLLILMHILGEFYFRTKKSMNIENGKYKVCQDFKWVLIHIGIYTVCFLPIIWLTESWYGLIIIGIIFLSHFLIDGITWWFKKKTNFQSLIFLLNQSLHIVVLIGVGNLVFYKLTFLPWNWLVTYQTQFQIFVCILLLIQPSMLFIEIIFSDIDFNRSQSGIKESNEEMLINNPNILATSEKNNINLASDETNKTSIDPGKVIGVVERLMAFILVLANAYAALALIITVKTWARQKEIQNIKGFGNKYLIGTMVSLTIAVGIGFFCTNVILK